MEFVAPSDSPKLRKYRGRLAPTPSGDLHIGHLQTFYIAYARSIKYGGSMVFRVEDLDKARCKPNYLPNIVDDLQWFGIQWEHGPGSASSDQEQSPEFGFFKQSKRLDLYLSAWKELYSRGYIYPSSHSRKDVAMALSAPHDDAHDPVFPPSLRPVPDSIPTCLTGPGKVNWRFRVPDGQVVSFMDNYAGQQTFIAGIDFGDFLVWRSDGFPSYELAVVVDDAAMGITEVVRGFDLLKSTARQLLVYQALGLDTTCQVPEFFHCPLVCDGNGVRLAKRNRPCTIRNLRFPGTDENMKKLAGENVLANRTKGPRICAEPVKTTCDTLQNASSLPSPEAASFDQVMVDCPGPVDSCANPSLSVFVDYANVSCSAILAATAPATLPPTNPFDSPLDNSCSMEIVDTVCRSNSSCSSSSGRGGDCVDGAATVTDCEEKTSMWTPDRIQRELLPDLWKVIATFTGDGDTSIILDNYEPGNNISIRDIVGIYSVLVLVALLVLVVTNTMRTLEEIWRG